MDTSADGSIALEESTAGQFRARGRMTFGTASVARETGMRVFAASSARDVQVDCGGITASDSAGMTVLLDWLAFAKTSGRSLHYRNLPEQVKALARISDVLELLERGV